MQGTLTVSRFPVRALAIALVAASILMLGILGGYLFRGVTAPAVSHAAKPKVVGIQREQSPWWAGLSDLTRAVPTVSPSDAPAARAFKHRFAD